MRRKTHDPSYLTAIREAWHLVWDNKILWVFGLLAVVLGQFGLNSFVGNLLLLADDVASRQSAVSWVTKLPILYVENTQQAFILGWLFFIMALVGAFVVAAAVLSQGALVVSTADYFKNKTKFTLLRAWRKGVEHFWRLLALNILRRGTLLALMILTGATVMQLSATGWNDFVWVVIMLAIVTILALCVSCIAVYATGYVMEYDLRLIPAIFHGARLFSHHLLVSLELSLVLMVLNALVIGVVVFASFVVLAPALVVWVTAGFTGLTGSLLMAGLVIALFIFAVFTALAGAVFNAFTTSAWMYLFMHMHHYGLHSRLLWAWKRLFKMA